MQHSKELSLMSIALVIVISVFTVCSITCANTKKANADILVYNDENVYYFSDPNPTLDKATMTTFCNSYFYDIQYGLRQGDLRQLYADGHFINIISQVVVFEIKDFLPDYNDLYDIFHQLHNNNCEIVFVSGYDLDYFPNTDFMAFVSDFIVRQRTSQKCNTYIHNVIKHIIRREFNTHPLVLLIDGRFFGFDISNLNFEEVYDASPFFRTLLYEWRTQLLSCQDDAIAIHAELLSQNVYMLVHIEGNNYYDLTQGSDNHSVGDMIQIEHWEDIAPEILDESVDVDDVRYFAMGISNLDGNFYSMLHTMQMDILINCSYLVPIYVWELEPITYGIGGLSIITDSELYDICYDPDEGPQEGDDGDDDDDNDDNDDNDEDYTDRNDEELALIIGHIQAAITSGLNQ